MTGALNIQIVDKILVIEIDNPPHNVITTAIRAEMAATIAGAHREHDAVRAMLFIGAGDRAFCAGADLTRYSDGTLPFKTVDDVLAYDAEIFGAIEDSPLPAVAAIEGYCIGGGLELAAACDIRICSTNAKFRSPGVRLGMIANTTRLTKRFGHALASDLVLTGRTVAGEEAARLGLVTRCVAPCDLRAAAFEICRTIAERAPLATSAAKRAIAFAVGASHADALRQENETYLALRETEDHAEAVRAFFEKVPPVFKRK